MAPFDSFIRLVSNCGENVSICDSYCKNRTILTTMVLCLNEIILMLQAYIDVDYPGSLIDRRSTSRYCTFLGGNLVTWRSKKPNVLARSSAKVEFQAMAKGVCELL